MAILNQNLRGLEKAVERLGPLSDDLVFLGGCVTGLLITDPAAAPIRASIDVDVITEMASLVDYYGLSERLRKQGFVGDRRPDAPLCRWVAKKVILDVMPTNEDILGFSNQWYKPAIALAISMKLPSGRMIRVVSPPYFLATKLEAFDGRGNGDYSASHDMEDIVALLDGRPEIVDEVKRSKKALRTYLRRRFEDFLTTREFMEALPGHLLPDEASQKRAPVIIKRIQLIAGGREDDE